MKNINQLELSILIPCFNEQDVIEKTVIALMNEFNSQGVSYEILCVNNASTDNTENILACLEQQYSFLRYVNTPDIAGYGVAVRWGLQHYYGKSIVIVMADGSESPSDVLRFYRKIDEGYDCVFGSRFMPNSVVEDYPKLKLLFNRLGNRLISMIIRSNYDDYTNGFKCYRRELINQIQPLYGEKFNLTIEMSISAAMIKPRIAIIENSWRDRSEGMSKFNLVSQSILYLLTLSYCVLKRKIQGDSWEKFRKTLLKNYD